MRNTGKQKHQTTTRFLTGDETKHEIRRLLSSASEAKIAVAYWGRGAWKELGLTERRPVQIVCNLQSGACHPKEVRLIRDRIGNGYVLTHPDLHAKVYWTPAGAVIGSSNASANGLRFGDNGVAGLVEGNILTTDPAVLANIERWFDDEVFAHAAIIRDDQFAAAEQNWDSRPKAPRHKEKARSLLDALQSNPEQFRRSNIYVSALTHDGIDGWAETLLERERGKRNLMDLDCYQNWEGPKGSFVIEFDLTRRGPRYCGTYWILKHHPVVGNGNRNHDAITLCQQVTSCHGFGVNGDVTKWQQLVRLACERQGSPEEYWASLHKFAHIVLPKRDGAGAKIKRPNRVAHTR